MSDRCGMQRYFWIVLLTAISESLPKARQVKAQNVILGLVTELVYLRVPKARSVLNYICLFNNTTLPKENISSCYFFCLAI